MEDTTTTTTFELLNWQILLELFHVKSILLGAVGAGLS